METSIGVFSSRDRAEEALKELLHNHVPEDSIVYLTRSESEAIALGKEIGTVAGGFTGGAIGLGAGMVAASLALIPGIGQVFAVGVGAAALLGFLGTKTGAKVGQTVAKETQIPAPTADKEAPEDAELFLEVLKAGRSLVVVRTESPAIAKVASGILDRATETAQPKTTTRMQAGVRQVSKGVAAVDVKGRIVVGEGNIVLRETIQKLVDDGNIKVLLVMQEVEHIDSSGIGEIVRAHAMMRRLSGQLKVVNPSAKVQEVLQMTMLQKVLDVHKDEASAIKSFGVSSAAPGTS
ncbi:MAG: STAS domain-containing protein [Candidatus Acidiferrales bacterium]|jgi:anti-anti-sigma factor